MLVSFDVEPLFTNATILQRVQEKRIFDDKQSNTNIKKNSTCKFTKDFFKKTAFILNNTIHEQIDGVRFMIHGIIRKNGCSKINYQWNDEVLL